MKMMRSKPIRFFLLLFGVPALIGTFGLVFLAGWNWLGSWLLAVNLAALLLWGYDKMQSRRRGWRVPEAALHIMSILGATPAAFIGMKVLRHKTMKMHFKVFYVILFIVQIALLLTLSRGADTP